MRCRVTHEFRIFFPLLIAILASCAAPAELPPPAFPHGALARGIDHGIPVLFHLPGKVSAQAFSRVPGGYLAWDGTSAQLTFHSSTGEPLSSWSLEAAEAWVGENGVLTRERLRDGEKGSLFRLYHVHPNKAPRLDWEGYLDCAVSDVAFIAPGKAFIAGQSSSGIQNRVWEISRGKEARVALETGSWDDSLCLIRAEKEVIAFSSYKTREKRPFRLYAIRPGREGSFRELAVAGIAPQVLCASGFGFSLRGEAIIPVALSNGDYGLLRLREKDGALMPVALSPRAGRSERPLGTDAAGGMAFYLATDPLEPSRGLVLGRYNGVDLSLESILYAGPSFIP